MRVSLAKLLALSCLYQASQGNPVQTKDGYQLRPFRIDLSSRVPRMIDQIKRTELPAHPVYINTGTSAGISLSLLESFRTEWLTTFNWDIEGSAIPLLLVHGWPGSFLEFAPIINELTDKATTTTGKKVSFDVVVVSLPGFAFSSVPPVDWTVTDTARVFNTLMTKVLHYDTYATFGTDWGAGIAYSMYDQFNSTVRAVSLDFLPFHPYTSEQLAAEKITLSPLKEFEQATAEEWNNSGEGYFIEQTSKANTIGLALYDNPVGQLAWIGEKFVNWSDPNAGISPSVLTHNEILRGVSLYYLTESFASSVIIYQQNPNGFATVYTKANSDAPLLFSAFKYNVGFWPPAVVAKTGNLVLYSNHEAGGHFPGLDNPPALLEDLREIATYWSA